MNCGDCGKKLIVISSNHGIVAFCPKCVPDVERAFMNPRNKMISFKEKLEEIIRDFEKIKKYLHIKGCWLNLSVDSDEGLCNVERKIIILGIKNGVYNRKLLVHECVHATGMNHNVEKGYIPVIKFDSYSADLEKKIFKEAQK